MCAAVPSEMKAVVCHGPGDYRVDEVATPKPGRGEVLAEVEAVGICASDLKCFQGAPLFWGDAHREGYCQPPVIPGHEFVTTVVDLDEEAHEHSGLVPGDRAVSEQIVPCWTCRYCRDGAYWMCQVHDIYGFRTRAQGAMADYMVFPRGALNHKVPDTISAAHAAYIEPLSCAIHATERGNIRLNDVVVVAGAGPIGLGIIAAARAKSPALLIAVDLDDTRLELAGACGADLTLNPRACDAIAEVRKLTDGYGCDVYLEATGHPSAVEQGLHMIRKMGTFVEFSVMREAVTVDWTIIGDSKELNIHGAHLGPHSYPVAIRMIEQGLLPMDRIITHRLAFDDIEQGMELVGAGDRSVKVTLSPS